MKIAGFNLTPSVQRNSTPPAQQTADSGDMVQLSGGAPEATKGGPSGLRKFGKSAAKVGIVLAGVAIGAATAACVSTIGGAIGIASLSLGCLAQLSSDTKVKAMGSLLMLGPFVGTAGALGAICTGLSVGAGVCLSAAYAADAHKLATQLLDR